MSNNSSMNSVNNIMSYQMQIVGGFRKIKRKKMLGEKLRVTTSKCYVLHMQHSKGSPITVMFGSFSVIGREKAAYPFRSDITVIWKE